jgi:hypothetical protein
MGLSFDGKLIPPHCFERAQFLKGTDLKGHCFEKGTDSSVPISAMQKLCPIHHSSIVMSGYPIQTEHTQAKSLKPAPF